MKRDFCTVLMVNFRKKQTQTNFYSSKNINFILFVYFVCLSVCSFNSFYFFIKIKLTNRFNSINFLFCFIFMLFFIPLWGHGNGNSTVLFSIKINLMKIFCCCCRFYYYYYYLLYRVKKREKNISNKK